MWRTIPPEHGLCAQAWLSPLCSDHSSRTLIFACLRDKPIAEMAQILFPLFDQVFFAPIHSARAAALGDLMAAAQATGTPAFAAESVGQAIELARHQVSQRAGNGVIVISGSVFLVGEARSLLLAVRGAAE
jgi:dihydrofolate synthase/folylpolyglutamate synthase